MVYYCLGDCETKHCVRVEEDTGWGCSVCTDRVLWQDVESRSGLDEIARDSADESEEMLLMRQRCAWCSIVVVLAQAMVDGVVESKHPGDVLSVVAVVVQQT